MLSPFIPDPQSTTLAKFTKQQQKSMPATSFPMQMPAWHPAGPLRGSRSDAGWRHPDPRHSIYNRPALPTHVIKEGCQGQYAHWELSGFLDFWFYDEAVGEPVDSGAPESGVELFVGGLWAQTRSGVLPWLVGHFGHSVVFHDASGHSVGSKKKASKGRRFLGCAHIRLDAAVGTDVEDVIANLHCSVLFDRFGAWVARSETQKEHLAAYCAKLKRLTPTELQEKVQGLPSHALTCELAKRHTARPGSRPPAPMPGPLGSTFQAC
jgi:hypothetical protein